MLTNIIYNVQKSNPSYRLCDFRLKNVVLLCIVKWFCKGLRHPAADHSGVKVGGYCHGRSADCPDWSDDLPLKCSGYHLAALNIIWWLSSWQLSRPLS